MKSQCFAFYMPSTERELLFTLSKGAIPVAGLTDVMVKLRTKKLEVDALSSVNNISSLKGVKLNDNRVTIMAATTYSEILGDEQICRKVPILCEAVSQIGSTQIRNRGTLVGNIVNASPAGDGLLVTYLLDGVVEICSEVGRRTVSVKDFVKGPGQVVLERGEYVRSVSLKVPPQDSLFAFVKIGQRSAMAISVASVGALIKLKNGAIEEMRIALGSVAPTVVCPLELEKELLGTKLTESTFEYLSGKVSDYISPIDDIRASAWYRGEVVRRVVKYLHRYLKGGVRE
ncbi:MAG: xanthine dehydrogenase family protein subunit M [Thermotogae bacterium]|nr:xanthine dehydrogenase family protein subunit M [Thermotogota bacterium]